MRYIVTALIPVRSTTSSRVKPDEERNNRSSAARRRSRTVGVWRLPGTTPLLKLVFLLMQACIVVITRAFLTGQSCTRRWTAAAFGQGVSLSPVSAEKGRA